MSSAVTAPHRRVSCTSEAQPRRNPCGVGIAASGVLSELLNHRGARMETRTRRTKRFVGWGARLVMVAFFVVLGAACGADGSQDEVQTPSPRQPGTTIDVGQDVHEFSIEAWRRRRR